MDRRRFISTALPMPLLVGSLEIRATLRTPAEENARLQTNSTQAGGRFATLGGKPGRPLPLLFVFATSAEVSLQYPLYVRMARLLMSDGVLPVSLDLPCHGKQRKPEEPEGLSGWRFRMENGQNPIREFVLRAREVLNFLIAEKYAQSAMVAACGTSRGAFAACHFAGWPKLFAPAQCGSA